jgi:hypothetical protein
MPGSADLVLTMLSSTHARQQARRAPRTRRDNRGVVSPYPWEADDARRHDGV